MRRSTLAICALLTVATYGCDKLKLAWDKVRGKQTATQAPPAPARPGTPQTGDTAAARRGAAQQPQQTARVPQPPALQDRSPVLRDVPYISDDTGTIAPGMPERDIYMLWGPPEATRRVGEFTYLYFKNGCEYTCGTLDVVILQNGGVVDAILRWDGHRYSGESSSPPGKMPIPNPGDTLRVPPP